MKTSPTGISLLHGYEKCRLTAYDDGFGTYTIGWGMTIYPDGSKVKKGDVITQQQADEMFLLLLAKFERKVNARLINPSQQVFDAAVDFCYNAGTGYRDKRGVYKEFQLWDNINNSIPDLKEYWHKLAVTSGGVPAKGLVRRRKSEAHLALTGELNFFE
jgi:lysozyme